MQSRRRLVGFSILVLVVIGVVSLVVWMRNRPAGRLWVIIPAPKTTNLIAALALNDDGTSRVVAISPDGTIREPDGDDGEFDDREQIWSADGQRVIFVSNRSADGSYQLFDWIPDRDNVPFQLTLAGASRGAPWFALSGNAIVFTSRGSVLRLDYQTLKISTVYPPKEEPGIKRTDEEVVPTDEHGHRHDEATHMMEQAWQQVSGALEGDAFEKGYVTRDGSHFMGIYNTPRGRALVLQNLKPESQQEAMPRIPLMGADVEIAMHPTESVAVVSVRDFRWPNLDAVPDDMKNPDGAIRRPFVNALFLYEIGSNSPPALMFQSIDGTEALLFPSISPDGADLIVSAFSRREEKLVGAGLMIAPLSGGEMRPIAPGEAFEPSWSPDSSSLVFVREGDVWSVQRDGSALTNLTKGKGRFARPLYSPKKS